jgi:uncharacterized protein involved in exopolysaccharide biosynthesis
MTGSKTALVPVYSEHDEFSMWALATVLLRHRRLIVALALFGAATGLVSGLTSTRVYTSTATFIPQGATEAAQGSLAAAASQLGLRGPANPNMWGSALYVKLVQSRSLLEPIVLESVTVTEQNGRLVPVMELLGVKASTPARRIDLAVRALAGKVAVTEDHRLGAVKVAVTTQWPSVSLALANRLVSGVNEFNVMTRRSQAALERQFVEGQVREAEAALGAAEARLAEFLKRNRVTAGSPQLVFEQDRLQRAVELRQELHNNWLTSREDARIREVRDIPVITVLEKPYLPFVGEPRKSVQKAVVGGLVWGALGMLLAFLWHGIMTARRAKSHDAGEFFRLIDDATPRFLKKHRARGS